MPTTTAFILVGKSHPNDGAIIPYHSIQLTEGHAPAYTLRSIDKDNEASPSKTNSSKVMIPSLDHPIDDLILMIQMYALGVKLNLNLKNENYIDIEEIPKQIRSDLYNGANEHISKNAIKIVISVIDPSCLLTEDALISLKKYNLEYQILK